ncbi:TraU family protein [Aliidiomarina quisquiliarum]|uniref:TraU family protein n=1 Tax=Aliidiomarina quisquiliarum TaxID=2938947 RepID=UPI00208E83BC|nr:TraU family protein [Aliidiomarina quisquiliarum]MCO4319950.1 TraU family protein [Aliidiomarina quisquiliarum]
MHFIKSCFALGVLLLSWGVAANETPSPSGTTCPSANVFSGIFNQVCWSCFIDGFDLAGINSSRPDGSSGSAICSCPDSLGIPQVGVKASYWSPTRINEVVQEPYCSPALGGVNLQNTHYGQGLQDRSSPGQESGFMQYHYFSYPLMAMLEMLVLPECMNDDLTDFDLLYLSELDPTWNDDMLALLLNPEAVLFGSPAALAWCTADCITTTADAQQEASWGCAGCDGSLYPFTGNIYPMPDPIAGSSLLTQRTLASLHRKGLARKTMGNRAMCERVYAPMIPRSQYKFSMIYPVPQATNGGISVFDELNEEDSENEEDVVDKEAEQGGSFLESLSRYGKCCHPMGMSTLRWCTAAGGRLPPGKDTAFVYLVWNYTDCCIR